MKDKPRTAEDIIANLHASDAAYQDAARREGDVWGTKFSASDFLAIRSDDQAAAVELRLNRNKPPGLQYLLWKARLKPISGLSLGCGSGRAERNFLQLRVCERFTGVDVAQEAIDEARAHAASEGLPIRYLCQDLNAIDLGGETFDLIVCQTILHHVLKLEHLLDAVERALSPGGVFYVHDYIGETQFQFSDERLHWYNQVMRVLPEPLRRSRLRKTVPTQIDRPAPGSLVSPFEAIRSGEIRGMLMERFDVLDAYESTSILDRVVPMGTRRAFLADDNTRAVFELLMLLDEALLEGGLLPPVEGRYLLRRKQG
jgi:2-polyprenyl-3-methyl-5-hydroxy-6-metoxy-1,4-benzoquinol methylase